MDEVARIAALPAVAAILTEMPALRERTVALALDVQQIPAPTFAEARRAAFVAGAFRQLGLVDVERDALDNVYGRLAGVGDGQPVVVSAHTDTVFEAETDLSARRVDGLVYGPGIGDNSVGVAGMMLVADMLRRMDPGLSSDVHFVANVGEEGLGDLRGMRAVVDRYGPARYVVVEGGVYGHLYHQGIAVRRFHIRVRAPGGHSWGAFGSASAIHVLGHIIAGIDQLKVRRQPRTTYNVGVIDGGTSVNTIAQSASLLLDLRSSDSGSLADLVLQMQEIVAREGRKAGVVIEVEQVGNRPPGRISRGSRLVRLASQALTYSGCQRIEYEAGSTDANIPLSKGYEAVCVGLTRSGNAHRLDEFMDPALIPQGLTQLLLLILAAAGVPGSS